MSSPLLIGVIGLLLGGGLTAVVLLVRQTRLAEAAGRLAAELDATHRASADQKVALADAQAQLRDSFAALSQDALRDNRQDFLHNADAVLRPVRETLERVQSQLKESERARAASFGAITSQLGTLATSEADLRRSTEDLARALRSPNAKGKWGELQLRRIVQLAGMLGQCDFVEKESVTTSDGARQTPDLIVRLPGGGNVVVDAKVPIQAYLDALDTTEEAERQACYAQHARQLKDHVRLLGAKEYWKQFQPAPEFVVMFLPLEPLLSTAFEQDGTLLEFSATLRVIPATPMTLLAVLRAVAYGWQQQHLADNAEEIRQHGRELYERLSTMVSHLDRVGLNIKQAADSYDRFIGSLEQSVLPAARRFKELGVSSTKEIETPERLALSLRRVTRDELVGPPDEPVEESAGRELTMPLIGSLESDADERR